MTDPFLLKFVDVSLKKDRHTSDDRLYLKSAQFTIHIALNILIK